MNEVAKMQAKIEAIAEITKILGTLPDDATRKWVLRVMLEELRERTAKS